MAKQTWQGRTAIKLAAAASAVVVSGLAGGCVPSEQPADLHTDYNEHRIVAPAGVGAIPAGQPVLDTEEPTPPDDARYTIYCQSYAGPDHQSIARHARDAMRASGVLENKWYVVLGAKESTLYYGFYSAYGRDPHNPVEGERAQRALEAVRMLRDSRGVRLFSTSNPVAIPSPDPAANPAWDIARSGGYWSLEVGAFKDTPDRKQRAVDAVAEFRRMGKPAYYYHGDHASSVLIGAWPRASASELDVRNQNDNPDQMVVVTQSKMSDDFRRQLGENVQAIAPHVEPVDPIMVSAMREFPDHFTNGSTLYKRGPDGNATGEAMEHSYLVKVSKLQRQDETANPADAAVAGQSLAPVDAAPQQSSRPGAGHLRSLEDR